MDENTLYYGPAAAAVQVKLKLGHENEMKKTKLVHLWEETTVIGEDKPYMWRS